MPLGSTPPQQAHATDIYDFVVSELNAIIAGLAAGGRARQRTAARRGPAAQMLLAKLYLNAGVYTGTPNYAGALTAAQAVICGDVHAWTPTSSACSRPTTTRRRRSSLRFRRTA